MAVQLSKSTIRANIYKNFYDVINAITGFDGTVFPKNSDKVRNSTSDYPTTLIYPASTPNDVHLTSTKGKIIGTILIETYATNDKDADLNADKIGDAIDNSLHLFATQGIRMVTLQDDDEDEDIRGKIKGFIKALTYEFEYYYTKPSGGF